MGVILAIDCVSDDAAVGVVERRGVPVIEVEPAAFAHSTVLLRLIDRVLGGRRDAIERVTVSGGPGRYAALRTGIATARGIATGTGVPLVAIGTYAAVAHASRRDVLAVHPAGGGAFGVLRFEGGRPAGEPRIVQPGDIDWREAAGEGAGANGGREIGAKARVAAMLELATDAPEAPPGWEPYYLRDPMITKASRSAMSRGGAATE